MTDKNNPNLDAESCQLGHRSMKTNLISIAVGTLLSSPFLTLYAQITEIGPFLGTFSETWESFPFAWHRSGVAIMDGAATISGSPNFGLCPRPAGLDWLGSSRFAQPSDGAMYAYIQDNPNILTFTFQTPVREFGGYWGSFTGYPGHPASNPAIFTRNCSGAFGWPR